MEKESSSYGLILSSIVAIVALVGLVMLFSKAGATGATSYSICPPGEVLGQVVDKNGVHQVCVPNVEGERPYETPADTNTGNLVK